MGRLMDFEECLRITVPACSVGLLDKETKKPFKKSCGFLTNSEGIATMLDKLERSRDHEHQVVEGRSGGQLRSVQAQMYPRRALNIILGGVLHVNNSMSRYVAPLAKQMYRLLQ